MYKKTKQDSLDNLIFFYVLTQNPAMASFNGFASEFWDANPYYLQ